MTLPSTNMEGSGDEFAPNFNLAVQDNWIDEGIRSLITSVEFESSDGLADLMKINLTDTLEADGRMLIRDSKVFMPGNDIDLFVGYGSKIRHLGRTIIRKCRPAFPNGGPPTLEVIGYTADSLMADSEPEALKEVRKTKKGKIRIKNAKAGRRWANAKYSDAVKDRASAYGFELDVDTTPEPPSDFIQKAKMTDYEFIAGLSNLSGFLFWVDGEPGGTWTLHFKNPTTLKQSDLQEKTYTFKYADGEYSTLLSFEPELAIQNSITKLRVQSKDPVTGRVFDTKIEEEEDDSPDTQVEPGNVRNSVDPTKALQQKRIQLDNEQLESPLTSSSEIKVFIEDFSFSIVAGRRFRTEAELANWAAQWWRRNRENFMLSHGTVIGLETLRARQQHNLAGLGVAYDGPYYFTRVRHVLVNGGGYTIDFNARRVVSEVPPTTSTEELQITEKLREKGDLTTPTPKKK